MLTIEPVNSSEPPRQGDLIEFETSAPRPFMCEAAVVLTADCDLLHDKYHGHLLLCPIVGAAAYFSHLWLPKRTTSFLKKVRNRVKDELWKASGDANAPSDSTVDLLLSSVELMTGALAGMGIRVGEKHELVRACHAVEIATRVPVTSPNDLAKAIAVFKGTAVAAERARLEEAFREELDEESLDTVVLPDERKGGSVLLVVLLRFPFSYVCSLVGPKKSANVHAYRIGRFASQIRFQIPQKLGYLFSRIGTPTPIEVDRAVAIALTELPA